MREFRSVLHVCQDKTPLLLGLGVDRRITGVRLARVVVVVSPFCEVIRKFVAPNICAGVFKVDDDQLLVLILRL